MAEFGFPEMSGVAFVAAFCIAALAGLIKGLVGFALPLIMVSGISSFLDPKLAIASLLIPVLLTNAMQVFRNGIALAIDAAREHWRYLLTVCVAIFIAAQGAAAIPSKIFYFVLGVPVVVICLVQLAGVQVTIPKAWRGAAEWIVGALTGIMGGLVGTWGPTTVLYLFAIETPKAKQMVVQGVIYGVGAIVLTVAHLQSGILNAQTSVFSASLVVPAIVGMWVGFQVQDRLDQHKFKTITLYVLILGGLNLIRKGIVG